MTRRLGEVADAAGEELAAHWAVLGKHPGRTMGYEVLRSSLPGDRASSYLWKAAATGAPGDRDPDGALPWRVFLGATDRHPDPVCASVATTWDGATDGTGAPSYTWRLTLFAWPGTGRPAPTWSGIDRALAENPPTLPAADAPLTVTVPATPPRRLADTIDALGFDWVSGVAALLLDNRQVAITPGPDGRALPDTSERVRVLDAVCALLPYGCRAWLSAATWTGQAQHDLRLFFAPAARGGQTAAVLGAGPPPEPRDPTVGTYLQGLRRLRAKTGDTAGIVAHLLTATEPAPPAPRAALQLLREADLLDAVVDEIRSGGGELDDIGRVLGRHPAATLDDERLGVLTFSLVGRARDGDRRAGRLLGEHWSGRTRALLVRAVLAAPTPDASFALARQYLGVVHGTVEAHRPGTFDALFHALVDAPEPKDDWAGSLIYMVEDKWARSTARSDHLLVRVPAVGKTWLRYLLKHENRSLDPLDRLVRSARGVPGAAATPGWLRFAAVLLGDATAVATATDAADFAEACEAGWQTTLDIARAQQRPEVLGLMWPRLWRVARTERDLGTAVQRLVPVGDPHTSGAVAADADLFGAATGTTPGGPGLPRLALLADGQLRAYTAALVDRIESDGELRRLTVAALLAGEPGPRNWRVAERLSRALSDSFLHLLCDEVHARLTGRGRPLDDLDVPASLMAHVAERYDLAWLAPVHAFRKATQEHAPYADLARILLDARAKGPLPVRLLDAVAAWTLEAGPRALEQVTLTMDELGADWPGLLLYAAMVREDRHPGLRERLTRYSKEQRDRHAWLVEDLRHGPDAPGPESGGGTAGGPERRGVLRKMGRRLPGRGR